MKEVKVFAAAFLVRLVFAIMQILTKAAFSKGMNIFVYAFYRQLIATIFMAPIAWVLERNNAPPQSFTIGVKIFMLALLGHVIFLITFCVGLNYTTTTAAAAMINSIPVVTFILAVLFSFQGIAKLSGLSLCLAGILILAFYKGPQLQSFNHHHLFRLDSSGGHSHSTGRWALGIFLVTISTATASLWLVLQGYVLEEYPAKLLFTTLQCFWSTIQCFFVALAFERDFSQWKLGLDVGLISVTFSGIMATAIAYYLASWIIKKKGPVFMAMSTPLTLVLQIICSFLVLGETVSLGSILSGVLMVGGLYSVLWGKRREHNDSQMQTRENENAGTEDIQIETSV